MEWAGPGRSLSSGWAGQQAGHGPPAAARVVFSSPWFGSKPAHACTPHKWRPGFPQPSWSLQRSSHQPKGLIPRAGHRYWATPSVAHTAHSPGRVSVCGISLFLWVPSQGHRSWPNHFSSLPTQLHMYLSDSLGCTVVLMTVSSYFSVRIVLHVDVFLMCLWGEVSFTSSYSAILIDLIRTWSLRKRKEGLPWWHSG